jgi:hypothetical protein
VKDLFTGLCLTSLFWFSLALHPQLAGADALPFELHGFIEAGGGLRTQNDPTQSRDVNYAELRLQIEAFKAMEEAEFKLRLDVFRDEALKEFNADLREAHVLLFPLDFVDLKVGRQVLTWGTGDLVFLNDLFPKDFESFFIGRDESYLKAPSNSIKASFFLIGSMPILCGTRCSSPTDSSQVNASHFSTHSSDVKSVNAHS